MVYIHENWSLYGPKVLKKLKLRFWRSFNQKNTDLLRKIQTVLNGKTLNSRKQIFCPEYTNTSLVKINLHKILRKINFVLLSIILFSQ